MSYFVTDLDKSKPTEFDPVADGAGELRSIKEALRDTFPNANTPLTVSNESIVEAVEKVNSGEVGNPAALQLAHCKYSDTPPAGQPNVRYAVNIESVTRQSDGTYVVKFDVEIKNFDYTIAITPAAINANPVFAYVTSQALLKPGGNPSDINDYTPNGFTMQVREFQGNSIILPQTAAFTILVVDNDPFGFNNNV